MNRLASPSRALGLVGALAGMAACTAASAPSSGGTVGASSAPSAALAPGAAGSLHSLTARSLEGADVPLRTYAGKVLLVVNTASECGYTPQYEGLQALHAELEPKGFAVLGFPSNDFGGQEPLEGAAIASSCKARFGVTFPLFTKGPVSGSSASPVFAFLGAAAGPPKWNFHKYLVGRDGRVRGGFPSNVAPASGELRAAIDAALAAPG
jgi:glutathione peroxidase